MMEAVVASEMPPASLRRPSCAAPARPAIGRGATKPAAPAATLTAMAVAEAAAATVAAPPTSRPRNNYTDCPNCAALSFASETKLLKHRAAHLTLPPLAAARCAMRFSSQRPPLADTRMRSSESAHAMLGPKAWGTDVSMVPLLSWIARQTKSLRIMIMMSPPLPVRVLQR